VALVDGAESSPVGAVSSPGKQVKAKRSYSPRVLGTKAIGPDGMTIRERQFVGQMYLNGFNPVAACKTLNLGGKRPDTAASTLMARPAVREAVAERQMRIEKRTEGTVAELVAELAAMALSKFDGPLTASHKLEAIKTLGNHRGMFKPDQTVVIPVTFQFLNGPPLDSGAVLEASPQPLAGPSTGTDAVPVLGKPERG
jgi:hypothetical protein